jgi:hypothetical protein
MSKVLANLPQILRIISAILLAIAGSYYGQATQQLATGAVGGSTVVGGGGTLVAAISAFIASFLPIFQKWKNNGTLDQIGKLLPDQITQPISQHKAILQAILTGLDIASGNAATSQGVTSLGNGKLEWSFTFTPVPKPEAKA